MKALSPTSTPTACRRWKLTATWVLSASLALPAWAAVPFTVNGNGTICDEPPAWCGTSVFTA